jgi:hypothetical protein
MPLSWTRSRPAAARGGRRSLKSAAAGWDPPLSLVCGGDGEREIREKGGKENDPQPAPMDAGWTVPIRTGQSKRVTLAEKPPVLCGTLRC